MRYHVARRATRYAISLAAAFFVVPALAAPSHAQTRPIFSERSRDLMAREQQLREIEKPMKRTPRFEQRILLRQINKDFERIQLVNLEVLQAVSSPEALDMKKVLKATDEIRSLAGRLKTNLLLPESEFLVLDTQVGQEDEEFKAALRHLNKKVRSFVRNPVFQSSSNVIDAKLSAQARHDLETIIELCRTNKKSVGKPARN